MLFELRLSEVVTSAVDVPAVAPAYALSGPGFMRLATSSEHLHLLSFLI